MRKFKRGGGATGGKKGGGQRGAKPQQNKQQKRKKEEEPSDDVHLSDLDDADFEFADRMQNLASMKDSDFDSKKNNKKKPKFNHSENMVYDGEGELDISEDEDDLKAKQLEENYSKTRLGKIMEKTEKLIEENEKEESQKKVKLKLPIKGEDGVIQKQVQVIEEEKAKKKVLTKQAKKDKKDQQKKSKGEDEEEEEEEVEEDEDEVFDSLHGKVKDDAEPKERKETRKEEKLKLQQILDDPILRDKRRQQLSMEIGSIASSILDLPDVNLVKISRIYDLCMDGDVYVRKVAILSMCALFKDLLPDYKINLEVASEGTRFSREVKARRTFESNILKHYQKYVQFVEKHAKNPTSKMQLVAAKCLSELLFYKPYFNFTMDIIAIVVPLLDSKNEQVKEAVAQNITALFVNDPTKGATTLDVVEEIASVIVKKKYNVSPAMFDVFLALKLKMVLKDKIIPENIVNRKNASGRHKKKAKDLNDTEGLRRDLKEAKGATSSEVKKYQTDTLRNIIVCYVRVLKQQPDSPIVFSALAGLAKFSHLMNVDLLYSLMDYMKALLESADNVNELVESHMDENEAKQFKRLEIPIRTVLQALITTARLLAGIGGAIDIDPKEFYSQLYVALDRVITAPYDETNFRLLMDALVLLLLKPQKLPIVRVAAFIKKMCCYCFSTHIHVALSLLEIVRELLIKYPNAKQMLSGEESGIDTYNFEETVPDSTTPFSSPLFELSQIQTHYHPQMDMALDGIKRVCGLLSKFQQTKAKEELKQLNCDDYQNILTEYDPFTGKLKPSVQPPKPHPLQEKLERLTEKKSDPNVNKKKKQKLQDKQVYVDPSMLHLRSAFAQQCLQRSSKLL